MRYLQVVHMHSEPKMLGDPHQVREPFALGTATGHLLSESLSTNGGAEGARRAPLPQRPLAAPGAPCMKRFPAHQRYP